MNAEALNQLRRVVEAAPDRLWHMETFNGEAEGCGTAHCAAGWAALDPWFQKHTAIGTIFTIEGAANNQHIAQVDKWKTFYGLSRVFGVRWEDALALFGAGSVGDVPKAAVLANIDRLLAGEEAEEY